ncbi:Cys-tRNA(Pro) deacylase [Magnetococcus sp. PR-3]|uniref:Cys-tRNA(Pro) deacylase n=1 Tax=Magnetococcus sp. PR-3 TaxID=3120355 RepID=UPI002FCDE830
MTPAINALKKAKVPHTVHSYEHDPKAESYGEEAAQKMGVEPQRVFKTLAAELDGKKLVVGVVPVAGTLDLKALAKALGGKKAAMAEVARAERETGYLAGGISPLGQKKRLPMVLDDTALDYDTICISAGRRGLEVELAPADLVKITGARTAPIGRL